MEETQPNNVSETSPQKVSRGSRLGVLISLLILVVALALGAASGYGVGVGERVSAKSTLVASQLGDQFSLVQQDIDAGRYSVARQRLEFIIQQNPSYAGAADKLAEVMVKMAITPSPVPTDTPTVTPTPDMRNQESIFAQAQSQLTAKDWTGTMGSLDSLRKADPTYKVTEVDSMYFAALRGRGIDQILGSAVYKTTNLEGGIYDLTLAERFGPLDGYAAGLRSFAREYIIAASFWSVNWPQAVNLFRPVYQNTPNLRDASNITAGQRLHDALLALGDQQAAAAGLKDRCKALASWEEAGRITPLDGIYSTRYNQLYLQCFPPTSVPATEAPTTGAPTGEPATQAPPAATETPTTAPAP